MLRLRPIGWRSALRLPTSAENLSDVCISRSTIAIARDSRSALRIGRARFDGFARPLVKRQKPPGAKCLPGAYNRRMEENPYRSPASDSDRPTSWPRRLMARSALLTLSAACALLLAVAGFAANEIKLSVGLLVASVVTAIFSVYFARNTKPWT